MLNLTYTFNDESAFERPDPMTDAEYTVAFGKMFADYFEGREIKPSPYLLYVSGLPGAGKSTFVKKVAGDSVVINFDDLRIYHPRYAEHVAKDPVNAAARIDIAVEKLIAGLCAEAAKRKIGVVLDDAAMGGEVTKSILKPFAENNYMIDAMIVAVPASVARQAVQARFEKDLADAKEGKSVIPRWVNSTEQDAAPAALIDTVKTLEEQNLAHRITVIGRHGLKLKGKPSDIVANVTLSLKNDNGFRHSGNSV